MNNVHRITATSKVRVVDFSQISYESRKHSRAIRRIGKNIGVMGDKLATLSRTLSELDFSAVNDMQKQMEAEAISEITEDMVESVMEKTMMSHDAAKALLVSARLDDLWRGQDTND